MVMQRGIKEVLKNYNMPLWISDYVDAYIREDPLNSMKRATSFINVKRKRGSVTSTYVILPNGIKFSMSDISKILSLFYYGEKQVELMAESWSSRPDPVHVNYVKHFINVGKAEKRHLRAIKNLMDGLMRKPEEPPQIIKDVFSYIMNLDQWEERFIALYMIMRYSYSAIFGQVFYKVFYFVMPEFMRSFGKVYIDENGDLKWALEETRNMIKNGSISESRVLKISEDLLSLIEASVKYEISITKDLEVEKEIRLMLKVAIAYPLHELKDLGVNVDIKKEESTIDTLSDNLLKQNNKNEQDKAVPTKI
ncbi:membrane protein [Candidatus Mancarchaeum acidiphilum]|uniref:Membrane protein n=1 Tax=Candidatus Mancarchaeum acidiphilum TaxID=1920749 RepID=A0A218NM44_9ARCH|nr:hypothetical protein [Candidatus Mancarchaeum acidiphilum]ASI13534.1 membrane protein [Candidatus Mancarchaeum acidiphilum]